MSPYYVSDSILSLTSTQAFSMYIVCLGLAHSGSQPFTYKGGHIIHIYTNSLWCTCTVNEMCSHFEQGPSHMINEALALEMELPILSAAYISLPSLIYVSTHQE